MAIAFGVVVFAIIVHLLFPSRTQEMLHEWEAENRVEILKAMPLGHPWGLRWGTMVSQSQRLVQVLARNVDTGARSEMVLCLGGAILGLKVKRVQVFETRPLDPESHAAADGTDPE